MSDRKPARKPGRPGPRLVLRRLPDGAFELSHPRCVAERRDDFDEAMTIWRAGEPEEATEVLRFALEGCGENLFVHVALGRIALESGGDGDLELARGHFGYALELVQHAVSDGFVGPLPDDRPANRPVYEAIAGLVECLERQGATVEAASLRRLADRWRGASGA